MNTSDGLEFINRDSELSYLENCLTQVRDEPTLVILRSPSGFGKSALTEYLSKLDSFSNRSFCTVDPSIRGRVGSTAIHNGFFLQKIAENLDLATKDAKTKWPSFKQFLKTSKARSVARKKPSDILSKAPSLKHIYDVIYDYTARAFSFGEYTPIKLIASDKSEAVAICTDYIDHVFSNYSTILIVREVHHIDLHSLRAILLWCDRYPGPDFIMEYTSEDNRFEPEHSKLIHRFGGQRKHIDVLDLVQLEKEHLEHLIHCNVKENFTLTSDFYLSWDGNLRSIIELKFQVGLARVITPDSEIGEALTNLNGIVSKHLKILNSSEKMVLAVVLAHGEAVNHSTVSITIRRINPRIRQAEIDKALTQLEETHNFLYQFRRIISIRNDTIANSLRDAPFMHGVLALAERALRDHYLDTLQNQTYEASSLSEAVRQYFRLCAKTKDALGLVKGIEHLVKHIKLAQDQSIYVDVVTSAIESQPELFREEHDELIEWAAEIAYDTGDWGRALKLIELKRRQDAFSQLVMACSLQETGCHDKALEILESTRQDANSIEVSLAADLVEALIIGCFGEHDKARQMLENITTDSRYRLSGLIGYAYRFYEIVEDLKDGLPKLMVSIDWFDRFGLIKSKAYSQLAASVFLARSGKINEARSLISEANTILAEEIRDQHIILNNSSAVELLSENPDFQDCCDKLTYALRLARDDFSELTILCNLGITHYGLGELELAFDCAEKCKKILEDHEFADTDIYWPVCFNLSVIYKALGNNEKLRWSLQFPIKNGRPRTDDSGYWDFRMRGMPTLPTSHMYLGTIPWHPVYLSHWLVDMEGLRLLKIEQRR